MPYVEAHYRVLTGRENCAIAGLSMGSMQAAMAAFSYPEKFAWIGLFPAFCAIISAWRKSRTAI